MRYLIYSLLILLCAVCVEDGYAQKKSRGNTKTTTSVTKKTSQAKKGSTTSGKRSAPAKKETAAEAQRRERETQKEIAKTKEEIRKNEANVRKSLGELNRLQSDIRSSEKVVNQASAEVASLDHEIAELEAKIKENETLLEKMRSDYLKSLKRVRARKNSNSDLAFIFGAKNFNQALERMRYLRQIAAWRKRRTDEINNTVALLAKDKESLSQNRERKDVVLQQQLSAQNKLKTQYAKQDAMVADLKKNGKALQSHLSKKQAEANALKGRIAALIAEETRKAEAARRAEEERKAEAARKAEAERVKAEQQLAKSEETKKTDNPKKSETSKKSDNKKNSSKKTESPKKGEPEQNNLANVPAKPSVKSSGKGFGGMRGLLPKPVSGSFNITGRFGRHSLPDLPDVVYDNPGIDALSSRGASALAVYSGKVSGVYMIPGFSTVVIVNHGNYYTVYGNIKSASVKVGDSVRQGQNLGVLADDNDNPNYSSIHFEVWHNREKLNPEAWLR